MEGVAAEVADGAQSLALVAAHDALGRVLHHQQAVAAGNVHNGVHLAGHTGVVHGADDPGPVRNSGFDLSLVNVHGVGPDVNENQLCPGQHEGVGGAGEGVAGQDDLIPGRKPTEQGGHIQRGGAAGGQQHFLGPEALFHPGVAFFGELAVAADFAAGDGLLHISQLIAGAGRYVERNHGVSSCLSFVSAFTDEITNILYHILPQLQGKDEPRRKAREPWASCCKNNGQNW